MVACARENSCNSRDVSGNRVENGARSERESGTHAVVFACLQQQRVGDAGESADLDVAAEQRRHHRACRCGGSGNEGGERQRRQRAAGAAGARGRRRRLHREGGVGSRRGRAGRRCGCCVVQPGGAWRHRRDGGRQICNSARGRRRSGADLSDGGEVTPMLGSGPCIVTDLSGRSDLSLVPHLTI